MAERKPGKKPRVLKKTCSGVVFKRIMKEHKIDIYIINEETKVPLSTLFDWTTGVIPSNPEQLEAVILYLQRFDQKYTFPYFYFGTDGDREELKRKLKELEEKNKKLETDNYVLNSQISFFEEIRKQKKIEKADTRSTSVQSEKESI